MIKQGYYEIFENTKTFKRSENQLDGIFINLEIEKKIIAN
jgi:hypothetical protein